MSLEFLDWWEASETPSGSNVRKASREKSTETNIPSLQFLGLLVSAGTRCPCDSASHVDSQRHGLSRVPSAFLAFDFFDDRRLLLTLPSESHFPPPGTFPHTTNTAEYGVYFCCVDGDHAYDGVKVDFHNYDSFLEVGGFRLFDDSSVADFGVGRLMPEVLKTKKYRLIDKNPRSKPPIQKE